MTVQQTSEQIILSNEEFLSLLAHELRNPLAPILNSIHVIEKAGASGNQLLKNSTEILNRQLTYIVGVIDNLLDVAKIAKGELPLKKEDVEVCNLIKQALEESRPTLAARRHLVELALPEKGIWVNGDGVRLKQMVCHLLNNAAKFTETGGRISVTASYGEGRVMINVRDNGVGISQDALPEIFKPFSQMGNINRQLIQGGGLGIGLALAKSLATLHDGTIEAHSDGLGKGSEFSIILPLKDVREACVVVDKPSITQERYTKRLDIIVVDDHIDTAESLATLLKMWGHMVRVCHSGSAAIEMAKTFHPDAALLDIGLPDYDGYAVAEELKANCPEIVLIAISGYGQAVDRRRSSNAGFRNHLVKPVSPEKLQEVLADYQK